MGGSIYDFTSRSAKASTRGFANAKADKDHVFEQNKKRQAHESMLSNKITLRESVDSPAHPAVIPCIIGMDVTGSMGDIPADLVANGLPHIMSKTLERGIDISVLFMAIGDHISDNYPLQIGQFESGDDELDVWLTRTYLEGNGGGNGGESYFLPWWFAANRTKTDHWDKRGKKGYIITIGDEPLHNGIYGKQMDEIFGLQDSESISAEEMLRQARERYNVYHININRSAEVSAGWRKILGENLIEVRKSEEVAEAIIKILLANESQYTTSTKSTPPATPGSNPPIML